jgi:multidrug resistance efflux pump
MSSNHDRARELREGVRVATDDFRRACYQLEIGEGDQAAVDAARLNLQTMNEKLEGFSLAMAEERRLEREQAEAAGLKRRAADAKKSLDLMKARVRHAKKVDKAIDDLAAAFAEMSAINGELKDTLGTWGSEHRYANLIESTIGSGAEQKYIAGALRRAGLDQLGSINIDAMSRAFVGQKLSDVMEEQNRRTAAWASASVPEIMEAA